MSAVREAQQVVSGRIARTSLSPIEKRVDFPTRYNISKGENQRMIMERGGIHKSGF